MLWGFVLLPFASVSGRTTPSLPPGEAFIAIRHDDSIAPAAGFVPPVDAPPVPNAMPALPQHRVHEAVGQPNPPPPPAPTPCAPGYHVSTHTYGRSCTPCAPGRFWSATRFQTHGSVDQCDPCPKGRYQPRRGQVQCKIEPITTEEIDSVVGTALVPGFARLGSAQRRVFNDALAELFGLPVHDARVLGARPAPAAANVLVVRFVLRAESLEGARHVKAEMESSGFARKLRIELTSRGLMVRGPVKVRVVRYGNTHGVSQGGSAGSSEGRDTVEVGAWVMAGVLVVAFLQHRENMNMKASGEEHVVIPVPPVPEDRIPAHRGSEGKPLI